MNNSQNISNLKITHAPLPGWKEIGSILFSFPKSKRDQIKPWHSDNELAGTLSRSAWSLALIALWRTKISLGKTINVWVPDFFCNASLAPMRQLGVNLIFYPVTSSMTPDRECCSRLAVASVPDIFILVHYFGEPNNASFVKSFCIENGAWLVEDAAHVLKPENGIGTHGDFIIYSPHKHLAIPDGGVLVIRNTGPSNCNLIDNGIFGSPETWPDQLAELAKGMGRTVRTTQINSIIWLIKRVLQKVGIGSSLARKVPFAELLLENDNQPSGGILEPPTQSFIGSRMLNVSTRNLDAVSSIRKRNYQRWKDVLKSKNLTNPSILSDDQSLEWTPYLAVYQMDPELVEQVFIEWLANRLPVLTWPDMAPEVKKELLQHDKAWTLRHSRLYLPVHQTLNLTENK